MVLLSHIIKHIGNLRPLGCIHVTVYLEGDGWVLMAEPVGYFDGCAMGFDEKAGVRVTQIMDADLFHASLSCAFMELLQQGGAGDGDDALLACVGR